MQQHHFPIAKLAVGYDLTTENPELVSLTPGEYIDRPLLDVIHMGSFIPERDLKQILNKDRKNNSYYRVLSATQKDTRERAAIRKDISLIKQFFPEKFMYDILDYILKNDKQINQLFTEKYSKNYKPRRRRTYLMAIIKSYSRRVGRKFTQELLDDINRCFNYTRTFIKLFQISRAENDLIDWNLAPKKPSLAQINIQTFALHFINNINRLLEDPIIAANEEFLTIVQVTKKFIQKLLVDKKHRENLLALMRYKDNDYFSRLLIYTIAKAFVKEKLGYYLKPNAPGWNSLFLVKTLDQEPVYIRSLKFLFYSEFPFRKQLKDCQIYPEESP